MQRSKGFKALWVLILVLWMSIPTLSYQAQSVTVKPGDQVVVTASKLPVYVQAEEVGVVVEEMIPGMLSWVVATQTDSKGQLWAYLNENAYGWVKVEGDGSASLTTSIEGALTKIVAETSATLKDNPKSVEALLARASAYASLRQFPDAFADFEAAINVAPDDARLYDYQGKLKLATKDFAGMRADVERSISLGRDLPSTYNRLGIALGRLGDPGNAEVAFFNGIQRNEKYGLLYTNHAIALLQTGYFEPAMRDFEKAMQLDPLLGLAYANRGYVYAAMGQYGAALTDFDAAIAVDPYCAPCYLNRGRTTPRC